MVSTYGELTLLQHDNCMILYQRPVTVYRRRWILRATALASPEEPDGRH